jgi:hypothetical protein
MKQFEYKQVFLPEDTQNPHEDAGLLKELNKLGADGWEVVKDTFQTRTVGASMVQGRLFFLKREVETTITALTTPKVEKPEKKG